MKKYFTIAFIFFILIFNCSIVSDSKNGLINYYGFDFSVNGYNANEKENDIAFTKNYSNDSSYIFISPFSDDSNFIKDFGLEAFNYIDKVQDNIIWDSIAYIMPGHLYIAKCYDGYAKFKIISVSGSNLYNTIIYIVFEFSDNTSL